MGMTSGSYAIARTMKRLLRTGEHPEIRFGSTAVVRAAFGIRPYSAMFGALKVRDAVDVRGLRSG